MYHARMRVVLAWCSQRVMMRVMTQMSQAQSLRKAHSQPSSSQQLVPSQLPQQRPAAAPETQQLRQLGRLRLPLTL